MNGGPAGAARGADRKKNRRESIESFIVVFVAFLVFSIEAEGYVIPTGSMAPTLMGRHKEVVCPECGTQYTVNADSEVDSNGSGRPTGLRVTWGTCQDCRHTTRIDDTPSFAGDRIYAMKQGLNLPLVPQAGKVGPDRWEVTVFRLPEDPQIRYIKRLVGLPNETIRIRQGDLWRRSHAAAGAAAGPFQRLRRPLAHEMAMLVPVHDDAHRARSLATDPRWKRWVPEASGWEESAAGSYGFRAAGGTWAEIRYRNVVPDPAQWQAITAGEPLPGAPRATLITDFCSYNTDLTVRGRSDLRAAARPWFQPHWVGDLVLSCRVDVRKAGGKLRLELVKAGVPEHCELDLATGLATLLRGNRPLGEARATNVHIPGAHELTFANIDGRLSLIVDGALPFGEGRTWSEDDVAAASAPTAADLQPAAVAARDADLGITGLVLKRDIYYTQEPAEPDQMNTYETLLAGPRAFFDLLADPARYASLETPAGRDYPLGPKSYLMLGDNSPWSRDGRAWGTNDQRDPDDPDRGWDDSGRAAWEVPEALVIGKAFCVYWPHLTPVWPEFRFGDDLRFPFRPSVERMRWIR